MVIIILITLAIATAAFFYLVALFIAEYLRAQREGIGQADKLATIEYAVTQGLKRATREITSVLILGDD